MYYDFLQTHKKQISIAVAILLGVLFIWTTVSLVGRIGKVPVIVSVVPANATITLGEHSLRNGTAWLTPDTYTLSVSREGFMAQKRSIVVTDSKTENVVAVSLVAQSDDAKKWAEQNEKEYKDNERYGSRQARADGEYFTEKNPITTKLPFTDPYYKIGYEKVGDSDIKLTINTTSPRYRFYALEKVRQWDYDPTYFVIEFKDFKNPLEQL